MSLLDEVRRAARRSPRAVAVALATAGADLDQQLHDELRAQFATYPPANLFFKAIVRAAQWAGFLDDDPAWPGDALRFLETQAPFIKNQYRPGFRRTADPIAYLETWARVFNEPRVPEPPDERCEINQLVRFHQDAFTALELLDWKRERSWLGPWTFHGAFKIYVIHERRLWRESLLGAVTLPMGGSPGRYSFEAGWGHLAELGIVDPLPDASTFAAKMAIAKQAHAGVQTLAATAESSTIHINSGIYLLGAP